MSTVGLRQPATQIDLQVRPWCTVACVAAGITRPWCTVLCVAAGITLSPDDNPLVVRAAI